ncbi:proteasome accessory factor C [Arthrobacter sp. CAN_A212]|uniref:helix-turn-helix transcriptional regulator n=1 Tax=Arthrobacter sp. CAN_A212 TaxID=2787719 RepID=UPI0018C9D50A
MSAKRTERLLTLVMLLLSTQRGYTKEELFREIELYGGAPTPSAREKLFDRDKAMLREQGIPVQSFSDDPAFDHDNSIRRYRIDAAEYRLPAVTFSAEESAALTLAAGMWDVATLDSAAARALRKLQDRGAADGGAAPLPVEPRIRTNEPHWDEVWRATTSRRPIAFGYGAASTGREEPRTLQPWGMGSRFGHWYVVGLDLDRGEERYFRLSRMTTAPRLLEGTYDVPEHFAMLDSLASLDRADEPFEALVAVQPDTCHLLRTRRGAVLDGADGGWDLLRFPYGDPGDTAADIAAFGPRARAISPADLVAQVRNRLTRASAAQEGHLPVVGFTGPAPRPARRKASADARLRRLLDLVPYLLDHPGADMGETANRFGVSRDQLAADLELLFVSGPRYYPDGLIEVSIDGDRIFLDNADNLAAPVRLNLDEACTLIVGLDTLRRLPGLDPGSAAATAHAKLTEAAGDAGRAGKAIATTLTEDAVGPTLETIQTALRDGVRLELTYLVPARDEVTERTVEPIRAFSRDDVWYLQAWCIGAEAVRNFRLDRIQNAQLTAVPVRAEPRPVPAGDAVFSPTAGDELVTFILQEPARWVAEHYDAGRTVELADGRLAAEIRVATTSWIPGLVGRLGGDAVVAAPGQLSKECSAWLSAARLNYP